MQKPESVLENETHKILLDVEIQTDHLITRPDLVLINKYLPSCKLYTGGGPQRENKRKQKDTQILGPCQWSEIAGEHAGDGDTNSKRFTRNGPHSLEKNWENWKPENESRLSWWLHC